MRMIRAGEGAALGGSAAFAVARDDFLDRRADRVQRNIESEMIAQFSLLTDSTYTYSLETLQEHEWNVQASLAWFFGGSDDDESSAPCSPKTRVIGSAVEAVTCAEEENKLAAAIAASLG